LFNLLELAGVLKKCVIIFVSKIFFFNQQYTIFICQLSIKKSKRWNQNFLMKSEKIEFRDMARYVSGPPSGYDSSLERMKTPTTGKTKTIILNHLLISNTEL
jgi:hypothetical protein